MGQPIGVVESREVRSAAGQVLHADKNVLPGRRNVGSGPLELLVIEHPGS